MHQTMCQLARETGIHHSPVYSINNQAFSIKMSEETACAGTHYGICVYISQTCRSCYKAGRVGVHKLSVMGNAIYVLLQISSGMLLPKITKIGSRLKEVIAKIKRV